MELFWPLLVQAPSGGAIMFEWNFAWLSNIFCGGEQW